jgi:hypothetical protein
MPYHDAESPRWLAGGFCPSLIRNNKKEDPNDVPLNMGSTSLFRQDP